MRLTDKIKLLETLVRIPTYSVGGFTHGRIVYVSNVEGELSLWSISPVEKKPLRLTKEPIHWFARPDPRSKYVVFTRDVTRGMELQKPFIVSVEGGEEELFADTPPMRFFGMVWDGEKLVFSAASATGMGLYLAKKGSYEKLMDIDTIMYPTDIDGNLIVGSGLLRKNPKSSELFFYDLSTGEYRVYTPKEGSVNKGPMVKDGKVLFESNYEGSNKLYVYDLGEDKLYSPEFKYRDYDEYNPTEHLVYDWLDDDGFWVVAKKNGRTKAFINGKMIASPPGTLGYLAINGGKAYYSASSLTSPPKIYEVDLEKNEYHVLLDNPVPKEVEEKLGKAYFTTYKSTDGLEIPMYVVEAKAEKPGPSVVYVHGGPWSEVYDSWNVLINGLVVMGYHVLAPNFRGSTGYGEEFRLMDIGDPGGGDLEDVASAAKWAREKGLASKIAVMGYSYGGYMTYLALGKKPELWDAGVAGAGIVDWVEMYGLSDALFKKFIETLFNGYNEELMKERSPITYVDNVRAPLCIIHPQNDTRTPLKPILRYIEKLLEKRITFEVHVIPDMGHMVKTVDDIVKILLPAILFLDKYLKK